VNCEEWGPPPYAVHVVKGFADLGPPLPDCATSDTTPTRRTRATATNEPRNLDMDILL